MRIRCVVDELQPVLVEQQLGIDEPLGSSPDRLLPRILGDRFLLGTGGMDRRVPSHLRHRGVQPLQHAVDRGRDSLGNRIMECLFPLVRLEPLQIVPPFQIARPERDEPVVDVPGSVIERHHHDPPLARLVPEDLGIAIQPGNRGTRCVPCPTTRCTGRTPSELIGMPKRPYADRYARLRRVARRAHCPACYFSSFTFMLRNSIRKPSPSTPM